MSLFPIRNVISPLSVCVCVYRAGEKKGDGRLRARYLISSAWLPSNKPQCHLYTSLVAVFLPSFLFVPVDKREIEKKKTSRTRTKKEDLKKSHSGTRRTASFNKESEDGIIISLRLPLRRKRGSSYDTDTCGPKGHLKPALTVRPTSGNEQENTKAIIITKRAGRHMDIRWTYAQQHFRRHCCSAPLEKWHHHHHRRSHNNNRDFFFFTRSSALMGRAYRNYFNCVSVRIIQSNTLRRWHHFNRFTKNTLKSLREREVPRVDHFPFFKIIPKALLLLLLLLHTISATINHNRHKFPFPVLFLFPFLSRSKKKKRKKNDQFGLFFLFLLFFF